MTELFTKLIIGLYISTPKNSSQWDIDCFISKLLHVNSGWSCDSAWEMGNAIIHKIKALVRLGHGNFCEGRKCYQTK